jgi:DNA repair exonuclease SbcCD ATPase subunit
LKGARLLCIRSITIRNFLSIGNVPQSLSLDSNGLTLVLGENLDVGGANSRNGCGKSAVLQAISYALFGKPLTKIRLDNLVNAINSKEMLVSIDFECHGTPYRIERGRKPNVLRVFCNGASDEAQGENRWTQAEIDRLIGMSPTLFRHIVALNTFTTPFLREEAAVQREVIEELFGITQLSQRAETLKARIDTTKERLRDAEAEVKAQADANARIELAINRAAGEAEGWQTVHERRLADLQAQVAVLDAIDIDYEIALFDRIDQWHRQKQDSDGQRQTIQQQIATLGQEIARHQTELRRCETEVDAINGRSQTARLQAELARYQAQIATNEADLARLADDLAAIMAQLDQPDSHTCVTCGQGLAGTDHLATVIVNLERQQAVLVDTVTRLLATQETLAVQIATIETEIAGMEADIAERRDTITQRRTELADAIAALQADGQRLQAALATVATPGDRPASKYPDRDAVWRLRDQHARLAAQLAAESSTANPFAAKIDGLRSTLSVIDYASLNDLTSQFKHESFLHKLLTARDSFIRKAILDQNLHHLNRRLDHYLQQLGLPHEVAFAPDLTVEIDLLGASYDFEQLSRGEMNRIILATSWGFRDVWQSLNTSLNLFMVDECIDTGMDGAGVEATLGILTQMADQQQSVFLISHRDELRERIDNVLLVRKEQQFTTFA